MNVKKIATAISFVAIILMATACNTGQSMMHGDNSMGMDNWNYSWPQIIGGFLGGLIVGFLVGRGKGKRF